MKKVLALVLALCMTLCVAQAAMADMLSDIQEKGTLVVGANVGFPPYEFYYTCLLYTSCPYRKPTQVGDERILRRTGEPLLRNSAK